MTRPFRLVLAGVLISTGLAGCEDGSGPSQGFVVTGTIQNNTQAPIPPNARLVVAWVVSSGSPDYSYVFGQGTLDPSAGTFEIRLDQPPPSQALNDGALGVGIIVVTTNQSIGDGQDISGVPETELIGAAGQYGIIFTTDPDQAAQYRNWAAQFEAGYGVGVGVQVPADFDRFEPASPSSVVLIIDDLQNIEFVNWT
jgi:hypothetical protein